MKRFFLEESGQGLTEYGLILALIAIAAIGAMTAIGGDITAKFEQVSTELTKTT
jgi:pilus assembly protein Flp/PilA